MQCYGEVVILRAHKRNFDNFLIETDFKVHSDNKLSFDLSKLCDFGFGTTQIG